MDALENALRAEGNLFPRAQSMRRRIASGSQVKQSCSDLLDSCEVELDRRS